MFDNIGQKIKKLATVVCWLGIIASIVTGLIFMAAGGFFIGFVIAVFGSVASWIGSFFTYGYGQLIENSDILVQKKRAIDKIKKDAIIKTQKYIIDDNVSESEQIDTICPYCSKKISFTKSAYIEKDFLSCPYCDQPIDTEIFFR